MRFDWKTIIGVFAVAAVASTGCSKKEYGYSGPMTEPGPQVNGDPTPPEPTPPQPRVLTYSGVYQANAAIDFTQNGVLPGLDSPILGVLANLHTNPGTAIVNLGYAAGIDVLNTIGSTGRAILGGLLDAQLTSLYADDPSLDQAVTAIQNIAQIAKTTVLTNTITVHTPKTDHTAAIDLATTGATFHFVNAQLMDTTCTTTVPAAKAAAAKATFTMGLVSPRSNPNVADADITFSGASVTLPMGDFLMQAIGQLVFQPLYGTSDFKTGFVDAIPCTTISTEGAMAVANSGNPLLQGLITQPVLMAICTTAASSLADQLIAQISSLSADGVNVGNARGVLYDVSTSKPTADGISDRVGDGTWTWTIGGADVPSTFAGDKIANAL
jgi:hypothetical protein